MNSKEQDNKQRVSMRLLWFNPEAEYALLQLGLSHRCGLLCSRRQQQPTQNLTLEDAQNSTSHSSKAISYGAWSDKHMHHEKQSMKDSLVSLGLYTKLLALGHHGLTIKHIIGTQTAKFIINSKILSITIIHELYRSNACDSTSWRARPPCQPLTPKLPKQPFRNGLKAKRAVDRSQQTNKAEDWSQQTNKAEDWSQQTNKAGDWSKQGYYCSHCHGKGLLSAFRRSHAPK